MAEKCRKKIKITPQLCYNFIEARVMEKKVMNWYESNINVINSQLQFLLLLIVSGKKCGLKLVKYVPCAW